MSDSPASSRIPRRRNLAQDVADHIRDGILTGRLRPGTRIDQDAIAEDLGVSRLPVREALIALDQEGLVRTIPRRGTYVQRLERDDIADHYQLYGTVSGLAAARAVSRIDASTLAALEAVHDAMGRAAEPSEQEQLNFEFHRIINAAADSRRVSGVLRLLARSLPLHFYEFVPEWPLQAQHQHAEIIEAFRGGDAIAAQRSMEQHLNASARNAIEALELMDFFDSQDLPADEVEPPAR